MKKTTKEYHPLMAGDRWTDGISSPECRIIMQQNKDLCQAEISFLNNGYIDTTTAFLKKYLNKYRLYELLREHGRCPKCLTAEKILKSEKKKTTKE